MKSIFTILAIVFTLALFGQEAKTVVLKEEIVEMQKKKDILRHGPDFVQDLQLSECWVAPPWPENEIVQPTEVDELPNGTMRLSKDLPFVHTIRGAVYTYEHLRYSVR